MRRLHLPFLAATLALLAAPMPDASATADDGETVALPASLVTGLVGVANGQVAVIHVSNVHPPEPVVPPEPVLVLVSLIDDVGEPLDQVELELWPGRSASLQLEGPADKSRQLVRAGVSVVGSNPPDDTVESGTIQATLEIVDVKSGRTTAMVIPTLARGFDPHP